MSVINLVWALRKNSRWKNCKDLWPANLGKKIASATGTKLRKVCLHSRTEGMVG